MNSKSLDKEQKKEAIKQLRTQRKDSIANASALMKNQKKEMKVIRDFLKNGDATVPAIADGVSMPVNQTLWYVMAMKKYGEVLESTKEGAWFKYSLIPTEKTGQTDKDEKTKTARDKSTEKARDNSTEKSLDKAGA
ncbi:conserved hypothetical protein [Desulfamplus magnetovallimortis]|uniref:Winged helix-turn-helix domain-containing protein n=1 Tax=Desulfamplus magnetovallimortis TaxID=1246637 RepID=A0A1W1H6P9_9BACT|nr:hypothetical protein [Desulfamplus magnetovallimortis]SLM28048.1 conserved hypothetical protein [Desulfamplus magnetovallimortis]